MGFFGNIMSKLGFGDEQVQQAEATAAEPVAAPEVTAAAEAAPAVTAISEVDVVSQLESKAEGSDLNWKSSIVDLLKLLDIDSSLSARKELADELGYTGDKSDSASMNIWLHKTVLQKIAANGGNVPTDLA